jgi:hypothetical protein
LDADRDETGGNRDTGQTKTETGGEFVWADPNSEPDEPKDIFTDPLADRSASLVSRPRRR